MGIAFAASVSLRHMFRIGFGFDLVLVNNSMSTVVDSFTPMTSPYVCLNLNVFRLPLIGRIK